MNNTKRAVKTVSGNIVDVLNSEEFARVAAIHGTVAVVSDPHEIANVLGVEGVKYCYR